MKKIKAVALFSTAILATTSTGVYADELISDGTTSPSTEQVTPSTDTSSEVVIPDDGSTTPSTDTGSTTEPTVPVDPTTPSTGDNTGEDSPTVPGTSEEEPSTPDPTETEEPTTPSQSEEPTTDPTGQPGTVDVPTTDGGSASVTPDTSVPTNNPNISAETAANAGASQVGTTSQVTGQVVQDVTSEAPVYTNTGATIVSTQNGSVVLTDGTITSPEAIGATTNSDGTISVTTATGESTTLPMTGDTNTTLLSVLGTGILGFVGFLFKKRQRFN